MDLSTVEEVCDYLLHNIDVTILENFKKHKIDGSVFVRLTEEYLLEVAPLLCDRLKIKRAIADTLDVTSSSSAPEVSDVAQRDCGTVINNYIIIF